MKVGVISDTHGQIQATESILETFGRMGVALIIHCGDVGADVVPLFHGRPTHFVSGNVDDNALLRQSMTDPAHKFHDEIGDLTIEGCRVAFLHGDDVKQLHQLLHAECWDLICHGHTHNFSVHRDKKTLVLNPGALARTNFPSAAVVDFPSLEVTRVPL